MPQSTSYERIRLAAERRAKDSSSGTWALADAVLAAVPEGRAGRPPKSTPARGSIIDQQLADLAEQLTIDGVMTPNGDQYTADSLDHLRDTAMSWPARIRQDEAAYRTHQEAGSPSTTAGKTLVALCAVARRQARVRRPGDIESETWAKAVERVEEKLARPRPPRFPVAANDLRVALKRLPNVPGRDDETEDVDEVAAAVATLVTHGVKEFLDNVPEELLGNLYHDVRRRVVTAEPPELRERELGLDVAILGAFASASINVKEAARLWTKLDFDGGEVAVDELRRTAGEHRDLADGVVTLFGGLSDAEVDDFMGSIQ